ncbi:hypothetical protein PR048_021037 [Dryococelus australis]|uniref:DDE-1 domain-containing protein n=1 Tax=Dryococelus australis TaxID=614101 RepID=A0ABQ9GX47_9NEOP|nr:hypothetical protein PR048_021037 [Dryococelus australis]
MNLRLHEKPDHIYIYIYNLDKTCFAWDPSLVKHGTAVGMKGLRIAEGNVSENTAVVACVPVNGSSLLPLTVFKAANFWSTWKRKHDLQGTFYSCSGTDGHLAHIDIGTIEHAKKNNVTILKPPAHTSDILLPLDKSCFHSLKCKWDETLVTWYRENKRAMSKNEFLLLKT